MLIFNIICNSCTCLLLFLTDCMSNDVFILGTVDVQLCVRNCYLHVYKQQSQLVFLYQCSHWLLVVCNVL